MPLSPGHGRGTLGSPFPGLYTDAGHISAMAWPRYSHWLQPWRAYLETTPASTLLNGLYMQWNAFNGENPQLVAQMLARHGIRGVRYELGWGNINWDGTFYDPGGAIAASFQALGAWGLRPLVLLNANDGGPCPNQSTPVVLASAASAGATSIVVQDASALTAKFSGISDGQSTMCYVLFDTISGTTNATITLSRPLANSYASGATLSARTLKYRPFDPSNSTYYSQTLSGWLAYVDTIAQLVAQWLGTTGNTQDRGFDLEIWNELTFGSRFLDIATYYQTPPYSGTNNSQSDLLSQTAQQASSGALAAHYAGVRIGNGFANQAPWPASSQMPTAVGAVDKHPYPPRVTWPVTSAYEQYNQTLVNALGGAEPPTAYMPSYSVFHPEESACATQAESYSWDLAPLCYDIQGTPHGRYGRTADVPLLAFAPLWGAPCALWITETSTQPKSDTAGLPQSRYWYIKQKAALRDYCFNLHKGATLVNLFALGYDEGNEAQCQAAFLAACQPGGALAAGPYPSPDTAWTSPVLASVANLVAQFKTTLDSTLTLQTTRALGVPLITETHGHYQFLGDGTAAHPSLFNRDVFAFLPFQVNSSRFIVPYYVMTRDIMVDLPAEQYTVTVSGLAASAAFSAYDPISASSVPVQIVQQSSSQVTLALLATDYPRLLVVQE